MINEAVYALMEGVGSVEAIDTVMKLGMNHPMGPLALATSSAMTSAFISWKCSTRVQGLQIPSLPAPQEVRGRGLPGAQVRPRILQLPAEIDAG